MKSQTEIKILGYELKASSEAEFKSSSNQAIREKNEDIKLISLPGTMWENISKAFTCTHS